MAPRSTFNCSTGASVRSGLKRRLCFVLSVSLLSVFDSLPLVAGPVDPVPPLPAPTGNVVHVSTEPQLQAAVRNLVSNTTILIAAGTYRLTGTLHIGGLVNVALRGATGRRDDVVLVGPGMRNPSYGAAPNGIWTGNGAQRVLIANLTVKDFYFHPIILNGGTTAPRLYNVRLRDGGQQLLKSNPDATGRGNDNGIVEYSVLEFSDTSRDWYTNGVDVIGGQGWIIRHNLFRNIRAPIGQLAGPAILIWGKSRDTIVEGNTFLNCQRDIALGLEPTTPNDHTGGVVRNNFIYKESWVRGDAGINIFDSPNTRVLHNTVLTSGTYPHAIEYRFPDTRGVLIANNLVDAAIQARDGASATLQNNLTTARFDMFRNAGVADLHLLPGPSAALDKAVTLPDAGTDWDGDPRPSGAAPDLGADELDGVTFNNPPRVSITSPVSSAGFTSPASVSLVVSAEDTDGQIASVSFFVNGALRSTDTTAPYSFAWINVTQGSYTLRATAVDNLGASATSAAVSIAVAPSGGVSPPAPPPSTLKAWVWVDTPKRLNTVPNTFAVAGWAVDQAVTNSVTGIDAVHIYAYPNCVACGGKPMLLGGAAYGRSRPDVGKVFGARFTASGYHRIVTLADGVYDLVVFARKTANHKWISKVVRIRVN